MPSSNYVEYITRMIDMEAETKRLELEVKVQEDTEYVKGEGEEEYWDTYKAMKVIKAKWDLEFHKLNMAHYAEVWCKNNPELVEEKEESVEVAETS